MGISLEYACAATWKIVYQGRSLCSGDSYFLLLTSSAQQSPSRQRVRLSQPALWLLGGCSHLLLVTSHGECLAECSRVQL